MCFTHQHKSKKNEEEEGHEEKRRRETVQKKEEKLIVEIKNKFLQVSKKTKIFSQSLSTIKSKKSEEKEEVIGIKRRK